MTLIQKYSLAVSKNETFLRYISFCEEYEIPPLAKVGYAINECTTEKALIAVENLINEINQKTKNACND